MCGSVEIVKQEGLFVCQSCGTMYSVEEAKKMMIEGTVVIDRTAEVQNLIIRAKIEIDQKRNENAKNILNEALNKDPQNGEIHYLIFVCTRGIYANYEGDNYCDIFGNYFYALFPGVELKNAIRFCKKFASFIEEDISIRLSDFRSIYIDNEKNAVSRKLRVMVKDIRLLKGIRNLKDCDLSIDLELLNTIISKIEDIKEKKMSPLNGFSDVSYKSYLSDYNRDNFIYFSREGIYRDIDNGNCPIMYDDGYAEFVLKETEPLGYNMYIRFSDGKEENWNYFSSSSVLHINRDGIKKANYEFNKRVAVLRGDPPPPPPSKAGCYVATCVYGSYDCPEVWTLRRYRDNTLASAWYGRLFIRTYYAISPVFVRLFGNTNWFKRVCKYKLDRMVRKLQKNGIESTPYNDKNWK